jgi:hypothetical protein
MEFTKVWRDKGLIRGRIWVANDTSDAHVALAWVEVGRGLLPLFWGVGLFPLRIGSHWKRVFS